MPFVNLVVLIYLQDSICNIVLQTHDGAVYINVMLMYDGELDLHIWGGKFIFVSYNKLYITIVNCNWKLLSSCTWRLVVYMVYG